jgi:hypothetical protein
MAGTAEKMTPRPTFDQPLDQGPARGVTKLIEIVQAERSCSSLGDRHQKLLCSGVSPSDWFYGRRFPQRCLAAQDLIQSS